MMFIEPIAAYMNKGVLIGLIAALVKSGVELKTGAFKIPVFIGNVLICTLVGYSMWDLMDGSGLAHWQMWLLTLLMSINGFFVVTFLTNIKFILLGVRVIVFRDKASMDSLVTAYSASHGLDLPSEPSEPSEPSGIYPPYPQPDSGHYDSVDVFDYSVFDKSLSVSTSAPVQSKRRR